MKISWVVWAVVGWAILTWLATVAHNYSAVALGKH